MHRQLQAGASLHASLDFQGASSTADTAVTARAWAKNTLSAREAAKLNVAAFNQMHFPHHLVHAGSRSFNFLWGSVSGRDKYCACHAARLFFIENNDLKKSTLHRH